MTEREREALMRLTMCARNECVMCKYKDSCDSDVRFEFATKHMNILADALRKTENSSEKPNNCEYAENPSGDVWECGCFLDTYCEHQIYDRNPDGTINIVECGYEPKTEPTISKMEQVDEPQTDEEYINNLPWTEVGNGEQTENLFTDKDGDVWEWRGDAWYCISGDEPQTDCPWK